MSDKKENVVVEETVATAKVNVQVVELQVPVQQTLIGSVEMVNFKPANSLAGGKFSKDTHIVTISVPTKGANGIEFVSKTVFITDAQWKEYGCGKALYEGNYVKLTVEHCIAGVTGYKSTNDAATLDTVHEKSFMAFVNISHANADILMMYLESVGVSERLTDRILSAVSRVRESHEMLNTRRANVSNPLDD